MSLGTLLGPPQLIDIEIELLRRLDGSWLPADDLEISLGDHVALRCWNRGDHEVSAAVLMRVMSGSLGVILPDMRDLWPDVPVEFGTDPHQSIVFNEADVELVLAASTESHLVEEFMESPWEEHNFAEQAVARLGVPLRGKPSEMPISDGNLEDLLKLAHTGEFHVAAHALQALTLLQPPRVTRTSVSNLLREQLRMVHLIHRPWLIAIAANLGDAALRDHLRGIAADPTDPHQQEAIQALGEVGDTSGLQALASSLKRGKAERFHAARIMSITQQDFDVDPLEGQELAHDPASFWLALAAAQRGSFDAIQEHVTKMDDIGFLWLIGDVANVFYAIRELRPLSNELRNYLQEKLDAQALAPTVAIFYKELLGQTNTMSLTDGSRSVPDTYVEAIRGQLQQIPGITHLESFRDGADGWARISGLTAAHRGVLLNELLGAAVAQHSPSVAAATVDKLVNGWRKHLSYPQVAGLLSVLRQLEERDFGSISYGIELQIGWLLSRAPITRVLNLVNDHVRLGDHTDSDMRALVNAIVTHWDHVPPPSTAEVTRVPLMIQRIALAEDKPWRETRAWLEEKSRKGDIWSATITLAIGVVREEPSIAGFAAAAHEEGSPEDFGELLVVPRADDAVITPGTKELRFSGEQQAARVTFEITTRYDTVQLWISIYQRRPTTLLQELTGTIELGEREG